MGYDFFVIFQEIDVAAYKEEMEKVGGRWTQQSDTCIGTMDRQFDR